MFHVIQVHLDVVLLCGSMTSIQCVYIPGCEIAARGHLKATRRLLSDPG